MATAPCFAQRTSVRGGGVALLIGLETLQAFLMPASSNAGLSVLTNSVVASGSAAVIEHVYSTRRTHEATVSDRVSVANEASLCAAWWITRTPQHVRLNTDYLLLMRIRLGTPRSTAATTGAATLQPQTPIHDLRRSVNIPNSNPRTPLRASVNP